MGILARNSKTQDDVDMVDNQVPDQIFPPLPTIKDEEHLLEMIELAQVPNTNDDGLLEPVVELTDLKKSQSDYYTTFPYQDIPGIDPALLEFQNEDTVMNVDIPDIMVNDSSFIEELPSMAEEVDMEQELFRAFENLSADTTRKPPVSPEDLLTLLTFNSSTSVAVCNITTTAYESRSLINELLLLRLPGLFSFFGGEKVAGMDVQILEEIQSLTKTRKKEKERDSGQGKAPIKMSEARKKKLKAKADERRLGMSEQKAKKEALAALSSLAPGSSQ